jgi:tRNA-2-methylthio-N6-dimethylallyladenosine synthase
MRRGYSRASYAERVDVLREYVPDLELGSDWIVGFPGETEEDYATCESALASHEFAVNYIFKYDPRPGTRAHDELADEIPAEVKRERNQRLLAAAERVQAQRLRSFVGTQQEVLVEARSERFAKSLQGRTRHTLPVSFRGGDELVGRLVRVAIEEASAYGLAGALIAARS